MLEVARAVSKISPYRVKVGAVIANGSDILSVSCNIDKTHPIQAFHARLVGSPDKIFMHAEVSAIVKVPQIILPKCSIFVYRETREGRAWARPCKICMSVIKSVGIKKIFYSSPDGTVLEFVE